MSKQSLLLVDGDTRSLRVLEVSLRKAGFTVTPAVSVKDALDKLELHAPDLIISETKFPTELDGFELRRRLRASPDWADIPFVFLTTETAIENKIRGLELGVEDYLTKPIYIKEIVTRINILLQKRQRAGFDERKDGMRFAGRVADMPVVDVIQTIEVSRKSGIIQFVASNNRQAAIYFRDGKVIDAEAGTLQGEDAVYRLLTWSDGDFEVVFRTVRRREAITTSSQGLLMEGMRRLDEWTRLLEQLPPLSHRFEVDVGELAVRLGEVPDHNNRILRLIDGKRSLLEVIDASDFGDLECLQAVARLFFEGLLIDLDPDLPTRRDTGRPMPLVVVDEALPMPEGAPPSAQPAEAIPAEPAPAVAAVAVADADAEAELVADEHVVAEEEPVADSGTPAEAAAPEAEPETPSEPEPLLGAYRPSSLRLIDEAVAAAQLIEPSLFDGESGLSDSLMQVVAKVPIEQRRDEDPRVSTARNLVERNREDRKAEPHTNGSNGAAAAPEKPADDHESSGVPNEIDVHGDTPVPPVRQFASAKDGGFDDDDDADDGVNRNLSSSFRKGDTALRMIGSFGRDRAEASGEVRLPPRTPEPPAPAPARELVTIMPRRKTGEIPLLQPDAAGPPAEPPPPPPAPPAEAKTAEPPPPASTAVEPPPPSTTPPRAPEASGVVRRRSGPGPVAATLIVAGSLLSGATAFVFCNKRLSSHKPPPVAAQQLDAQGSNVAVQEPPDAAPATPPATDAQAVAVVPIDAAPVAPRPADAAAVATSPSDAAAPAPSDADRKKLAASLADKSQAALEEGDPDRALTFAEQSIALRRTQRALLAKARALQRLDRVDDSLAAIEDALEIDDKSPTAWEEKALVLWSSKRLGEARAAMQTYLQLAPTGHAAEAFKRLLESE